MTNTGARVIRRSRHVQVELDSLMYDGTWPTRADRHASFHRAAVTTAGRVVSSTRPHQVARRLQWSTSGQVHRRVGFTATINWWRLHVAVFRRERHRRDSTLWRGCDSADCTTDASSYSEHFCFWLTLIVLVDFFSFRFASAFISTSVEGHHQQVWLMDTNDDVIDGIMSGHCFTMELIVLNFGSNWTFSLTTQHSVGGSDRRGLACGDVAETWSSLKLRRHTRIQ